MTGSHDRDGDRLPFQDVLAEHKRELRKAARLSVLSPLVWPAQAALLALGIDRMLAGETVSVPIAAAFVALALLRLLFEWHAQRLAQRGARQTVAGLRRLFLGHAARRSPVGQDEDPARLASLMAEKLALVGPWAERFLPAMTRVRLVPPVLLVLVATQSWTAALALALTGPLIPLFMALIGHAAQSVARAQLVETGALNRLLIDRVAALADIRLLGAVERAQADLAGRSTSLRLRTMRVLRLAFLSSTVLEFMAALGVALVAVQMGLSLLGLVAWGGWGGQITPFGAIFVLLLAPDFYQPLRDLASVWHDRAAAEAALAELREELDRPSAMMTGAGMRARGDALPAPLVWRGLVLEPAPGHRIQVADGAVGPGEAVALMAPSGAGKSGLLAALAGLVPVAAGHIELGGEALSEETASRFRASFGWMPQMPRFPAGSLRDFLTSGREADPAVVAEALRLAHADEVVAALARGLDTRLGERGGGVSGGEGRRLLLARSLIAPPAVLLADEPTADLDRETAAAVTEALLALRDRGTALLVATHDPALAAAMDRVRRLGFSGEVAA